MKAVGTTGKRSVMLAVVVALALKDPDNAMDELWKELRAYKLGKAFVRLLESGLQTVHAGASGGGRRSADERHRDSRSRQANRKESRKESHKDSHDSSWWKDSGDWSKKGSSARENRDREGRQSRSVSPARRPPRDSGKGLAAPTPPAGTDINVVCGMIPVLDMDKTSVFHENVSWLLQTAMESSGKADSLYEFCDDKQVISACRRDCHLSDQDIGLVTVKRSDLSHIKAVGTSGKRSIMMAVVVALVLHDEVQCDDFQMEVWEYDKSLWKPLDQLIRAARQQCSGTGRSSGGGGRSPPPTGKSGGGGGRSPPPTGRSGGGGGSPPPPSKRKVVCEEEDDDDAWGDWGDAPKAKKGKES